MSSLQTDPGTFMSYVVRGFFTYADLTFSALNRGIALPAPILPVGKLRLQKEKQLAHSHTSRLLAAPPPTLPGSPHSPATGLALGSCVTSFDLGMVRGERAGSPDMLGDRRCRRQNRSRQPVQRFIGLFLAPRPPFALSSSQNSLFSALPHTHPKRQGAEEERVIVHLALWATELIGYKGLDSRGDFPP